MSTQYQTIGNCCLPKAAICMNWPPVEFIIETNWAQRINRENSNCCSL